MGAEPRSEYVRRKQAREAEGQRHASRFQWVANTRLAVFALAGVLAWLIFVSTRLHLYWLAAPLVLFTALVFIHESVFRAQRRAERAAEFYQRGLDRIDGKFDAGTPEAGPTYAANHPYARDLDLFGPGSLFQLLCTVRTRAGEETLAGWLCRAAEARTIRDRQVAVAALRESLDLREDLGNIGAEIGNRIHASGLAAWGAAPPVLFAAANRWPLSRLAALGLSACAAVTLCGWGFLGWGGLPFLAVFLVQGAFHFAMGARINRVVATVEQPAQALGLLALVSERLERESFPDGQLAALKTALTAGGVRASQQIARLGRLVDLLNQRKSQFFGPIAFVLLWAPHFAFAIESWRATSGRAIAGWLDAIGQLEALCALGGYTYEHPGDPFPEIVDDGPVFQAEGLAHPLLPLASAVRNDLSLGNGLNLLLVSGSNMSGKSTLLRTVGTNAVLACCGAPVRAVRLRLSVLQLGATLRVQDSLLEGTSLFYAEITKLRQLVDLAQGSPPLLFLLDEILHGTNSHDRRIGAEGVVKGLLARGAIGLVTTHDLALVEVANALGARAANVHFQDDLKDGKLTFDYRMRQGMVEKSNALELMRAVGLEV